ncbi:uncharacterized protein SCHCODRAFT_02591335 [Schizophyllum commune H4-8]|nr:uncharacterized protein SCHCODRAFT_02591335 [Schizophyllum commune H4-8]KAI5886276.1 hypothetical protein SCHCODRAFT_02591335 [Schizophyllum commune H4-8]
MRYARRRRGAFGSTSPLSTARKRALYIAHIAAAVDDAARVAVGSPTGSRIAYSGTASRSSVGSDGEVDESKRGLQAPSRSEYAVGAASAVEADLDAEDAEGQDEGDELLAAIETCHRTRKVTFPVL